MAHAFSISTQMDLYEFEACLVYRVCSKIATATQRNTASKQSKQKTNTYVYLNI